MMIEHTVVAITRTTAAGETFSSTYDTRTASVSDILVDVALHLGTVRRASPPVREGDIEDDPAFQEGVRLARVEVERRRASPSVPDGEGLPPISLDGPNLPNEWRVWMARQLLDSRLTDKEAYGCVVWQPEISDIWKAAHPPQGEAEMRSRAIQILRRAWNAGHDKQTFGVETAADAIILAITGRGKV